MLPIASAATTRTRDLGWRCALIQSCCFHFGSVLSPKRRFTGRCTHSMAVPGRNSRWGCARASCLHPHVELIASRNGRYELVPHATATGTTTARLRRVRVPRDHDPIMPASPKTRLLQMDTNTSRVASLNTPSIKFKFLWQMHGRWGTRSRCLHASSRHGPVIAGARARNDTPSRVVFAGRRACIAMQCIYTCLLPGAFHRPFGLLHCHAMHCVAEARRHVNWAHGTAHFDTVPAIIVPPPVAVAVPVRVCIFLFFGLRGGIPNRRRCRFI